MRQRGAVLNLGFNGFDRIPIEACFRSWQASALLKLVWPSRVESRKDPFWLCLILSIHVRSGHPRQLYWYSSVQRGCPIMRGDCMKPRVEY